MAKKIKSESGNIKKKPFYKKWWFITLVVLVVFSSLFGDKSENNTTTSKTSVSQVETSEKDNIESNEVGNQSSDDTESNLGFSISKVRNDVTGRWRKTTIAANIDTKDIALDYYRQYFESDDEIHAIVNFNYNTTTRIAKLSENMLVVNIHEYVDKEEHDANKLFTGLLLAEYWINIETGDIEQIQ